MYKVSIIIPAYNLGSIIKDAINSCLAQTYSNIEIIIINDGSTDNTGEVIKAFLPNSHIMYYEQSNLGVSAARNRGVEISSGDYIVFLDGDDLLQNDTIEKNIELIQLQDQIIDWLAFPVVRINEKGEELCLNGSNLLDSCRYENSKLVTAKEAFRMYEEASMPPTVWAMIFRREFFDRKFIEGRFEDTYMFLDLLSKCPNILLSPFGAYFYVNRVDSFINTPFSAEKWIDYTRARIKHIQVGELLFPERVKDFSRSTSALYYNLKYLKFKNRKNSAFSMPLALLQDSILHIHKNIFMNVKYICKCIISFIVFK